MKESIIRIIFLVICIFVIYYGDKNTGFTKILAKKFNRAVYNIILLVLFCIPFVIWYVIKDSAPVILREFIYGISVGILTLFGNYFKNRGE